MSRRKNHDDLKKVYQISIVVGIAIIASLFVYAIVVLLLKSQSVTAGRLATVQDVRGLRYVFYALSVGIVIILRVLRGLLLRRRPSCVSNPNPALVIASNLYLTNILIHLI